MSEIQVTADLTPLQGFTGAVSGILNAIGIDTNMSRMTGRFMDKTKDAFVTDTIAAHHAGTDNINHVFDWDEESGGTSDKPLFVVTKKGRGRTRYLTYEFLPSTAPVPRPNLDLSKSGENNPLKPHIFRLKALVMETMNKIEIRPKNAKGLVIPDPNAPRGYFFTTKPVTINPGGNSTGGFTKWWNDWFETRAQGVILEQTKMSEEYISKTGQAIIRDLTTGRFARGSSISFGYADAAQRSAELQMTAAIQAEYPNE